MTHIRNSFVYAEFNSRNGVWEALRYATGDPASLVTPGAPFDLEVDGCPFFGSHPRQVVDARLLDEGRGVAFTFEHEGLRLIHTVALDADAPVLRQSVRIHTLSGPPLKLTAVEYYLPGFCMGRPADCLFQSPGQIVPIGTPYLEMAAMPLDRSWNEPLPWYPHGWLESAPDASPGLIAIENPALQRVASCWLYSEVAPVFPTADGVGERVDVAQRHRLAAWLRPGVGVSSEGFTMLFTEGSLREHLACFRQVCYGGKLASATDVPDWLAEARLLQINPYPIAKWTARLEEVGRMGFNLLYLMPVWANLEGHCYAIYDHYTIDPGVGGSEDVKEFVRRAHALEMRVLFDFIPQGIGDYSPFVAQHADWLVRDEQGRPFGSHGWGPKAGEAPIGHTYSMDWGNPAYRRFMIEWALWNVREFDIDGFRTDALHWKEPNFDPANPNPAWQTMFGGVRLAEELRPALKALKPDAILLAEVAGPIFQRSHDAGYANGWFSTRVAETLLKGAPEFTAAQIQDYIIYSDAARPEGFLLANFSANHDCQHISALARQTPLGNTLSFIFAFARGFPFITWSELPGREPFFAALMEQRRRLTGFTASHEWRADHADVFTALWSKPGAAPVLAVANLSGHDVVARVALPDTPCALQAIFGTLRASSVQNGVEVSLPAAGYGLIELGNSA